MGIEREYLHFLPTYSESCEKSIFGHAMYRSPLGTTLRLLSFFFVVLTLISAISFTRLKEAYLIMDVGHANTSK